MRKPKENSCFQWVMKRDSVLLVDKSDHFCGQWRKRMPNRDKVNHTQNHDLSHSMAHYLLTIHKLREFKGYARVTDIAKDLGLTKGSVSSALNNLKKRELVQEESDSKFLSLTDEGHQEVHAILSSRTLLYYFLKDFLGVDSEQAHQDSCLMEHLLSEATREKFFEYMKGNLSGNIGKVDSDLDLSTYGNYDAFKKDQKGDTYLEFEN